MGSKDENFSKNNKNKKNLEIKTISRVETKRNNFRAICPFSHFIFFFCSISFNDFIIHLLLYYQNNNPKIIIIINLLDSYSFSLKYINKFKLFCTSRNLN